MKFYQLLIFVLSAVALISCGGGKENTGDSIDTVSIDLNDSSVDTIFTSPDLAWKDLQGNVSLCVTQRFPAFVRDSICVAKTTIPETIDTVCFTADGMVHKIIMWAEVDAEKYMLQNTEINYDEQGLQIEAIDCSLGKEMNVMIQRDDSGYISKISRLEKEDNIEAFSDIMKWENGRVSECTFTEYDIESTWSRKYNHDGRLISEKSVYVAVEEGGENTLSYNYVTVDSLGNWTERHIVSEYVSISYDLRTGGETRMTEPETYYVERRQIEYYP